MALLLVAAVVLSYALGAPAPTGRSAVLTPYEHKEVHFDPAKLPGVSGEARVAANAQGLRGDLVGIGEHSVVLLGGSTVLCEALDDEAALATHVATSSGLRVGAAARGGMTVHQLLPWVHQPRGAARQADVWVGMFGSNETESFFRGLRWTDQEAGRLDDASPFGPARSAHTLRSWYRDDGQTLLDVRSAYAEHSQLEALDADMQIELDRALDLYATALEELREAADRRRATVVLVTQPVHVEQLVPFISVSRPSWRRRAIDGVLGRSAVPDHGYVPAPDVFEHVVEQFDERTRTFAGRHGIELVDLARDLDGCAGCFYDQWHFSEDGARRAGERIGSRLAALE